MFSNICALTRLESTSVSKNTFKMVRGCKQRTLSCKMEENERNSTNWFSGCCLNKQLMFILSLLCLSSTLAGKI